MFLVWTFLVSVALTTPAKSTQFYLVKTIPESQKESLVYAGLADDVGSANESRTDLLQPDDKDYQDSQGQVLQLHNLPNLGRKRRRRRRRRLPRRRQGGFLG